MVVRIRLDEGNAECTRDGQTSGIASEGLILVLTLSIFCVQEGVSMRDASTYGSRLSPVDLVLRERNVLP